MLLAREFITVPGTGRLEDNLVSSVIRLNVAFERDCETTFRLLGDELCNGVEGDISIPLLTS